DSQRPTQGACSTRTSLPRVLESFPANSSAPKSAHESESQTLTVSAGRGVSVRAPTARGPLRAPADRRHGLSTRTCPSFSRFDYGLAAGRKFLTAVKPG